jgi:prolyl-tRNA synthetase
MYEAYTRIFARCGLTFRAVEADTGAIGGSFSHEFMVLAETGEDTIASCNRCSYAANLEKAEVKLLEATERLDPSFFKEMKKVETPGMRTIEEVTTFLGVKPSDVIKTLIFRMEEQPVAVLLRGDHEVNEAKLKAYLRTQLLELAVPATIESITGAPVGFAGAVGLRTRIIADWGIKPMVNAVMGANQKDYHIMNVNRGRDYEVDEFADLRVVQQGDSCPRCNGGLGFTKGIEVGHVFKLGDKYSKTLKAVYLDANGRERFLIMGCYGIGVGRTAAAAIEQSHDEDGIIWPTPIAPYHALVLPIDLENEEIINHAERLYGKLTKRGVETLLDDRDVRPGIKFKDADLIGIPIRVTIGPKHLKDGLVELRTRRDRQTRLTPVDMAADEVADWVRGQLGGTLAS